jgi:hypothetical protein
MSTCNGNNSHKQGPVPVCDVVRARCEKVGTDPAGAALGFSARTLAALAEANGWHHVVKPKGNDLAIMPVLRPGALLVKRGVHLQFEQRTDMRALTTKPLCNVQFAGFLTETKQ